MKCNIHAVVDMETGQKLLKLLRLFLDVLVLVRSLKVQEEK